MTSNVTVHIKDKKQRLVTLPQAIFRISKSILQPILYVVMFVTAAVSLLEPKPGTNSREVMWLIAGASLLCILAFNMIHKLLQKKSEGYKMYTPKFEEFYKPSTILMVIIIFTLILVPFYMITITSLKTPKEAAAIDFTWWIQDGVTFDAYTELFAYGEYTGIYMTRALLNSLALAIFPTLISVFVSAQAAFLYAHGRFKGRQRQFRALILTMLMPGCVTMGTSYLLMDILHWTGTIMPLVYGCIFGGAGTVMFLREFMMGLPSGLFEAAEIDGAGKARQFVSIALPLAKGAITGQFILGFFGGFNDFLGPLIYLNDPSMYTVQVALQFISAGDLNNNVIAAGCVFVTVPTLLVYICFQKQILAGISLSSGLKG